MKILKKKIGGREGGRGQVWGVRVDVIKELKSFWENSQKKISGGVGGGGGVGMGGVRVDVNEELKFLCKFKKKKKSFFWGGRVVRSGGGGGGRGAGGRVGGSGWM